MTATPPPPPMPPAAPPLTDAGSKRTILIIAGIIFLIIAGVVTWFLMNSSDDADFTAVSASAETLQQACFDTGLFYDEFGSCYEINPASILPADRPQFVVAAGSTGTEVAGEATATQSGGSNTGQSNPGTSNNAGGTTGQSNPGTSTDTSTDTGTTGQSNPGTSTDTSTDTDTGTTTTEPTTTPTEKAETPTERPITPTDMVWKIRVSPTMPEGGCGSDARVDGKLPKECTDFQRAYGGTSNYRCTHASNGAFSCTESNGNGALNGNVTRTFIALDRTNGGTGSVRLTGSNAKDGNTPGMICSMSGSSTETVQDQNGTKGEVSGTWTATSNTQGC
ncbi:MAG: hypothetical protein ACI9AD_000521 [Nitriliruptoraceae bacterium]|jgi:hypothetical protein